MTSKTFRIAAFTVALMVAGLVGLTVGASNGTAGKAVSCFLAAHMGHGGHHCSDHVLDELGLTSEQRQRFDTIHELLGSFAANCAEEHAETRSWLLERVQQGDLTSTEVRALVDRHLEEIRALAYAVGDEAVPLVNGLDDGQRQLLSEHLGEMHAGMSEGRCSGGSLGAHFRGHGH